MDQATELFALAGQVASLEARGLQLSSGWYQFEPGSTQDIEELSRLSQQSSELLKQLSTGLSSQLETLGPADLRRNKLQYAYNMTQELIQSRQANQEMLSHVLGGDDFQEFLRALSLKEKAAAKQAITLQETIRSLVH